MASELKRELSAIVNMEGRTLKEIGYNLPHAIPNKHRHLIQNPNLNDHKEMMEAIVNKLGYNWINMMKPITEERTFIGFVWKLEKFARDSTALDQLKEMANSTMVSKRPQKF